MFSRTFIEYSYLFTSLSLYIIAYILYTGVHILPVNTCIDCSIQAVKPPLYTYLCISCLHPVLTTAHSLTQDYSLYYIC